MPGNQEAPTPPISPARPTWDEMVDAGYKPWKPQNWFRKGKVREAVEAQKIAQQRQNEQQVQDQQAREKKRAELFPQIQNQHPTTIDQVTPQYEEYYRLINDRPHKPFDINEQLAIEMTQNGEERWEDKEHPSNQSSTREAIDVLKRSETIQKLVDQSVGEGGLYFAFHLPTEMHKKIYGNDLSTIDRPYVGNATHGTFAVTPQLEKIVSLMKINDEITGSNIALTVAENPYLGSKSRIVKDKDGKDVEEYYYEPVDNLRMISFTRRIPNFVDAGYREGMEKVYIALPQEVSEKIMTEIREHPLAAAAFLEMYREQIGFPLYEVSDVNDMNQRRQDAIPVLPFSEVRVREFDDSPFLEKNNPLTEDEETPYADNMVELPTREVPKIAPTSPDLSKRGDNPILKVLQAMKKNPHGRMAGLVHINEGQVISEKAERGEKFKKKLGRYQEISERARSTAGQIEHSQALQEVAQAARELVTVTMPDTLNAAEQAQVDRIAIAAADQMLVKMQDIAGVRDVDGWGRLPGINLLAETVRAEEQTSLDVTNRTSPGNFEVTIVKGPATIDNHAVAITEVKSKNGAPDRNVLPVRISQLKFENTQPTHGIEVQRDENAGPTRLVFIGANGVRMSEGPIGFDKAIHYQLAQGGTNLYRHQIELKWQNTSRIVNIVSNHSDMSDSFLSYVRSQIIGKNPPLSNEEFTKSVNDPNAIVRVSVDESVSLYPIDPDGIRIQNVIDQEQIMQLLPRSEVVRKSDEARAQERIRVLLESTGIRRPSLERVAQTVLKPEAGVGVLLGVDPLEATTVIREARRLAQQKANELNDSERELSVNHIVNLYNRELNAIFEERQVDQQPAFPDINRQNVLWRVAELMAREGNIQIPLDVYESRARNIKVVDGESINQAKADIEYLLRQGGLRSDALRVMKDTIAHNLTVGRELTEGQREARAFFEQHHDVLTSLSPEMRSELQLDELGGVDTLIGLHTRLQRVKPRPEELINSEGAERFAERLENELRESTEDWELPSEALGAYRAAILKVELKLNNMDEQSTNAREATRMLDYFGSRDKMTPEARLKFDLLSATDEEGKIAVITERFEEGTDLRDLRAIAQEYPAMSSAVDAIAKQSFLDEVKQLLPEIPQGEQGASESASKDNHSETTSSEVDEGTLQLEVYRLADRIAAQVRENTEDNDTAVEDFAEELLALLPGSGQEAIDYEALEVRLSRKLMEAKGDSEKYKAALEEVLENNPELQGIIEVALAYSPDVSEVEELKQERKDYEHARDIQERDAVEAARKEERIATLLEVSGLKGEALEEYRKNLTVAIGLARDIAEATQIPQPKS